MSPESLYDLVHNLDEQHKATFKRWVLAHSRKTKREPKILLLFKRLSAAESFDETSIRKKHFLNPSDYYRNRDLLLKKIVECFSSDENRHRRNLNLIYTAINFGAIDLAREYFLEELKKLKSKPDPWHLLELSRIRKIVQADFKVDISKGADCIPVSKSLEIAQTEDKAEDLIEEARMTFSKPLGEKNRIRKVISNFIEDSRFRPFIGGFFHLKLLIANSILGSMDKEANELQLSLADEIIKGKISVRRIQAIREISNAVTFSLRAGDKTLASYYRFQLSQMPAHNENERALKQQRSIFGAIEAGFVFGDGEMTQDGLKKFWDSLPSFPETSQARYPLLAATTFLMLKEWDESHSVIRKLLTLPRNVTQHLPWQIDIFDLYIHYEKGNFDYLEQVLDAKRRKFRGQIYPTFIIKKFQALLRIGGIPNELFLKQVKKEQQELTSQKELQRDSKYFNFEALLESKVRNCPPRLIFEERTGRTALSIAT